MLDDLTGKRALVTGAAGGIGLAVAQRLAAGGARVALVDQNEFDVKAAAAIVGPGAVGLRCDVRSNAEVAGAFAEAISALGGLDVLVNNASIEIASPLLEMSESDIQHLFDVNVLGMWRCVRAAAQALLDAGGTVVNIASVAGLGNVPLLGAYSGANAAVLRFTESLAFEFRPYGVRVNAVCPAFVDTPTIDRVAGPLGEVAKAAGMTFEQLIEMKQMRLGRPEEVAETVAFLASEDSAWTTGSAFALDGGMTGGLV